MRARPRQAAFGGMGLAVALLLGSGLGCNVEPRVQTVSVSLDEVPSCPLARAEALSATALGDFPPETVPLDPSRPSIALDDLPFSTRALGFLGSFGQVEASSLVLLDARARAGAPLSALLLPHGRSCPLGDPLAFARPGAALAALPWGGLLIAGGLGADELAESGARVLPAGGLLVEQVADGMLLRRAFASATAGDDAVLIAGGVAEQGALAHDTFEVFERDRAVFARERSQKLRGGPRMRHGALRLRDGRVLLVGGQTQLDGAPLATAELIDLETGQAAPVAGELSVARIEPTLVRLGAGALVLGGHDADGAPVLDVEVFDAERGSFRVLPLALSAHVEQVFAALPDERVAVLGCDVADGAASNAGCELFVLPTDAAGADELTSEPVAVDFDAEAPAGLRKLRMLAFADGRLLLTAEDPSDVIARRAFVIDLGRGRIERRDATRVPAALVRLFDDSVAELDAFGASLRRDGSFSRELLDGLLR